MKQPLRCDTEQRADRAFRACTVRAAGLSTRWETRWRKLNHAGEQIRLTNVKCWRSVRNHTTDSIANLIRLNTEGDGAHEA